MKQNGLESSYPCPALSADNIKRLSAAGSIDTSSARIITFDSTAADVQMNIGSTVDSSDYFALVGGGSYSIDDIDAVYCDAALGYILN